MDFSRKEKRTVLFAVTIGNLLEWYEIYLYVYWAPILAELFFDSESELINLTNTFLIFAIGFLARPIGGIFFGRLGDRIGRRKSMILSVLIMTIPTFVTGLLPTHAQVGIFAPLILVVMRILQAFPAGGELPGAICYLYESSGLDKRRYLSSWASVGYQMGILISTIECYLLEKFLTPEDLISWGWRVSFLLGGIIGLCGLCLRYRLHETTLYQEMMTHETIVAEPILKVLNKYKKGILIGILFCVLNSSEFYLLTVNIPNYLGQLLGTSYKDNFVITSLLVLWITIPLPFFGMLADKYSNKKMAIGSVIGTILLLYPLYYAITSSSWLILIITIILIAFFFTCISALLPYLLANLFPTRVRFTCVGLSFNTVDAIVGGFTPVIVLYLTHYTGNSAAFCWLLLFCAFISCGSYLLIKKEKHVNADHTIKGFSG